ncbi:hypothetical protein Lbir_2835 [Legionella birminghamensis]|uniref:Uncharacterized protein n=2 Tax=Legionella birminghamensis TaxID=28083 RepID=A0A378I8D6_9GAMM|nr:hypothetical protein Lbir_2835 [Legionella birminghamensis]STX31056.1 Uncharacterised protein [Legionella birminghamensis]
MLFDDLKELITRYENPEPEQLNLAERDIERLTSDFEYEPLARQIEEQKLTMQAKMHFYTWQTSLNRQIVSGSFLCKHFSTKTRSKIFEMANQSSARKYDNLVHFIEALYALRGSLEDKQEAQAVLQCIVLLTAYKTLAEASGTPKKEVKRPQPAADCVSSSAPKTANPANNPVSSYAELLKLLSTDPEFAVPEVIRVNQGINSRKEALQRLDNGEAVNSVAALISQLKHMCSMLVLDFSLYSYLAGTIKLSKTHMDNLNDLIHYLEHYTATSLKDFLESYLYIAPGKKTDVSALTCLLKNPLIIPLFEMKPELVKAISDRAMNNLIRENKVRGEFPVFILFLIFDEHFNYFQKQPRLVSLISKHYFLQKFSKLDNLSPAEYLMNRPDRRSFFTLNPGLINWLPSKLKITFEEHFSPRVSPVGIALRAQVPAIKSAPPAIKISTDIPETRKAAEAPLPDKIEEISQKMAETKLTEPTPPKPGKDKSSQPASQEQQISSWKKAIAQLFGEAQNLVISEVQRESDYFRLKIQPPEINSYWHVKTSKSVDRISRFYASKAWFESSIVRNISQLFTTGQVEVIEQQVLCKIAWTRTIKSEQLNKLAKKIMNALKTSSAEYHNALRKPVIVSKQEEIMEEHPAPAAPENLPKKQAFEKIPPAPKDPKPDQEPVVETVVADTRPIDFSGLKFDPRDVTLVYRDGLRARYKCSYLNAEHHSLLRNNEFWHFKLIQHFGASVMQASSASFLPFTAQFPVIAAQEYQNLPDDVIDMFIYAKEQMLVSSIYERLFPVLWYKEKSGRSLLHCIRETNSQQVIDSIFSFGIQFFQQQAIQVDPALIQSPLHWAICCNQGKEVISELLQNEPPHIPFAVGNYHYAAIHRAVYESAYEAVEGILEESLMQLSSVDSLNRTAFDIAYSKQDKFMLDLLGQYQSKAMRTQNSRFFVPQEPGIKQQAMHSIQEGTPSLEIMPL